MPATVRVETHLLVRQDMVVMLLRWDLCLEAYVRVIVRDAIACVSERPPCQQASYSTGARQSFIIYLNTFRLTLCGDAPAPATLPARTCAMLYI